jgi:hypothetical protein
MAPKTERFEMRLETTMIERVNAWRRKQEDLPSRAEAFRLPGVPTLAMGRSPRRRAGGTEIK